MTIYDPLSEALGVKPIENPSYLDPIKPEELELIKIPPCMSEETKKYLSDYWKNYWKDKSYPNDLRQKISKSLKGRIFSDSTIIKMSEAQKKPIRVNNKDYDSGRSAAKDLGVSPACIVKWLKNGKASYIKCE